TTNRLSVFHVLEDLPTTTFPVHQPLVAVSCWNVPPDARPQPFEIVLRIHFPGRETAPQDFPMLMEPGDAPVAAPFSAFPIFGLPSPARGTSSSCSARSTGPPTPSR